MSRFNDFLNAYFEAIYFTELGDLEQPSNSAALDERSSAEQIFEAKEFFDRNCHLFMDNEVQAGHDFWFTRQGHGVGFWDRPEIYGEEDAELLTDAAMEVGEVDELIWNEPNEA